MVLSQKLQRTSSQASKDQVHMLTSFKDTIPQALKDKAHKFQNFKAHQTVAHNNNLQGYKARVQSLQNSGPQHSSFKTSKPPKFKTHQVVAHNTQASSSTLTKRWPTTLKLEGFKAQAQSPPSNGPQQQGSKIWKPSSSPPKDHKSSISKTISHLAIIPGRLTLNNKLTNGDGRKRYFETKSNLSDQNENF